MFQKRFKHQQSKMPRLSFEHSSILMRILEPQKCARFLAGILLQVEPLLSLMLLMWRELCNNCVQCRISIPEIKCDVAKPWFKYESDFYFIGSWTVGEFRGDVCDPAGEEVDDYYCPASPTAWVSGERSLSCTHYLYVHQYNMPIIKKTRLIKIQGQADHYCYIYTCSVKEYRQKMPA